MASPADVVQYDLFPKISPYLDKHLLFPLLEHIQKQSIYAEDQVLRAQLELLTKTKLVDFAMDKYKLLHKTEDVPEEMTRKRQAVVSQLKELKSECKALLAVIEDPNLEKFRPPKVERGEKNEKIFRDALVQSCDASKITHEQVEALYKYAKLHFECGNYGQVQEGGPLGAAELLPIYRMLAKDPTSDNCLSALWGKLAAEILLEKWDDAAEDLKKLRDIIDTKQFASALHQLQQRTWLIHWSLFVYLKPDPIAYPNHRTDMIDLLFSDRYLQAIQTNCPHVLRYLAAAVITSPRRRVVVKDLVRAMQQEAHGYRDPLTEFLQRLLVHFDFDGAQDRLRQCEAMLASDYLLEPLREELVQSARLFIFETYCRIHQCIDVRSLADKLAMSQEQAEVWIVNLIRNARLDAKIDSEKHHVIMGSSKPSVYQQVINKTKSLCFRSYVLAGNLHKHQAGKYPGEDAD